VLSTLGQCDGPGSTLEVIVVRMYAGLRALFVGVSVLLGVHHATATLPADLYYLAVFHQHWHTALSRS
jgi:hypothetical protein